LNTIQNKTYIIAEAGSNWKIGTFDDDLKHAKLLIKSASESGADAVKFQTYKAETTYAKNAGNSKYLKNFGIHQDMDELFRYLSMPYTMLSELASYSKQNNIDFMSTPFSVKDAQEIDPYVKCHKIASYEINHIRLLEFLVNTGKPLIVSTGASTYDEIDFTINFLKKNNVSDISLLQCTASYPCDFNALNLSVIPTLKNRYGLPVGLSDHSIHPTIAPVLAVGYGATIIEKHFTLDKTLSGPDHKFALNVKELETMVNSIRSAENAMGSGLKDVLPEELELKKFAKRSIQALKNISKGEIFHEGINFDILRPGNNSQGLSPQFLKEVQGKKSIKNYNAGDGIMDFE